ncbi:MAG: diguanylate cyclase [Thermodesulfovibrionales bacterium]
MLGLSRDELQETLKQLGYAIDWHEKWLAEITRAMICRLPYDHRDVADDAYRQCRFAQWYYGKASQVLNDHPSFVAIESEHRSMHQLAGRLLLASTQEVSGSPREYDSFKNAVERLHLEIDTLKHEIEESLYNRDALTGAENRIGMLIKLRELRELVNRHVLQCAVVIMDLDYFKVINDNYGHSVGDQVLVALVQSVKQHLRPYDKVYRYGGEEFLISLPNTNLETAHAVIERMRAELAALAIATAAPKAIFVTVSFGITLLDSDVSVEESINRADTALYAAKRSGRNRACIWDPSMTSNQEGGDNLQT